MKRGRQMSDPRAVDLLAIQYPHENVRVWMRNVAEWIRADASVHVDHVAPSNEPALKIRAALRQRMSFMSSAPSSPVVASARSFARPVHIVTSLPHNRRFAPSALIASSSMP